VLGSFYKDGLDRGEKAAHIVDPENREEHLKRLADAGIPAQKIMDTGQLDVLPWTDAYVRDHRFDQDVESKNRCNLAQPPATHLLGWWDIISTPLQ
jgi:hypothetical protein